MYQRFFAFAATALLPWTVAACKRNQNSASQVKVTNGILTDANAYPSVVKLSVGSSGFCTGTFVSDTTVLTAAHCILLPVVYKGITALSATRHTSYRPEWDPSHDIGVVTFPAGIAPGTSPLLGRSPEVGEVFTIIGWGMNKLVDNSNGSGAHIMREGTNSVAAAGDGVVEFEGTTAAGTSDDGMPTGADAAPGHGDSGGPLFIADKLAATCSGGMVENGRKQSVYTDLSSPSSQDFLASAVAAGADIPGFAPAAGPSPAPAPAPYGPSTAGATPAPYAPDPSPAPYAPAPSPAPAPNGALAANGKPYCEGNGGQGYGDLFDCGANLSCRKDDGTTYADSSTCVVRP